MHLMQKNSIKNCWMCGEVIQLRATIWDIFRHLLNESLFLDYFDWKPEFFQLGCFTADVALAPLSAGVFLRRRRRMQALRSAACFTLTQRCHLQTQGRLSYHNIHTQDPRKYEPVCILSPKCLDTLPQSGVFCCFVHLLSGVGFDKQGLKPPEIIRCPRKNKKDIWHIKEMNCTFCNREEETTRLTCSGFLWI